MFEFLFFVAIVFAVVALMVGFIYIPIMIATARGIDGGQRAAIIVLSWLGIFFGITWVVALILSLVWHGATIGDVNLEKLDKLSRLYKDGALTKAEFDALKARVFNADAAPARSSRKKAA